MASGALPPCSMISPALSGAGGGPPPVPDYFARLPGRRPAPPPIPTLAPFFARAHPDVNRAPGGLRAPYRRIRPHVDNDAPLCVERDPRIPNQQFSFWWT